MIEEIYPCQKAAGESIEQSESPVCLSEMYKYTVHCRVINTSAAKVSDSPNLTAMIANDLTRTLCLHCPYLQKSKEWIVWNR